MAVLPEEEVIKNKYGGPIDNNVYYPKELGDRKAAPTTTKYCDSDHKDGNRLNNVQDTTFRRGVCQPTRQIKLQCVRIDTELKGIN